VKSPGYLDTLPTIELMSFKMILCLLLFAFPISVIAQGKNDSLLLKIFLEHKDSDIFRAVDGIKRLKKDNIIAKIKALPASSRSEIIRNADQAATAPWALLTLTEFNEFKLNGNRVNYENHYFSRRNKLNTLIIGELVANDGRYLKEIVTGIGLVCEESTWALPAHMSLQKAGNGLPDVKEPIIDLFVSQTAMILAHAKYLLKDELESYSPLLIRRIDSELKKRVFDPYLTRDDFWWMGFNTARKMNNWNIFINLNVLNAAVLAEEDPKLRRLMIEKSIRSVDKFVKSYPSDGGCDEGPSYWGMAGGALIEYVDLLSAFSGAQLNFSKTELIHQIGTYIYKVHIDKNYYVNFADAALANAQDAGKVFKFGKLFKDEKLLQFAAYLWKLNNGAESFNLGNIDGFVSSLEIRDEIIDLKAKAPQLRSAWLKDLQVLTARQEEGSSKGLFFSAKGGNNGESHNHNDVGNFVVYKDGTPMVVDAGVGVYTRQTFSSNRYKLWYMQSDWHNCPTINGVMQQAGASYKATAVNFESKGNLTKLSMDLASSYPKEAGVNSWNRTFVFNHKGGILSLNEDYNLKMFKESPLLNFLVNGTVTLVKPGVLSLTNAAGKTLSVMYDPGKFDYTVEIKKIDDARLAISWHNDFSHLVFKRKGTMLKGTHQIEFRN
jgi:hypothetical protein